MITLTDGEYFETKEVKIDVDSLIAEKTKLETAIVDVPTLKLKPDAETLELWNGFVQRKLDSILSIEKKIATINVRLAVIAEVKDISVLEVKK